ncbi:hypothetical protein BKA70DRAFT_1535548 [Coprinopsis sp. MPI-PUGE-AT-0042]|nr:hypothetical protein BKA70DRAFT_1535548 [Coprinopsis sp. MPI-PUGE-AT-0042]
MPTSKAKSSSLTQTTQNRVEAQRLAKASTSLLDGARAQVEVTELQGQLSELQLKLENTTQQLQNATQQLQTKLDDKTRQLHNKSKQLKRAQKRGDSLLKEKGKLRHALKMHSVRKKAKETNLKGRDKENVDERRVATLKDTKGTLSLKARAAVRQLTGLGVPEGKINDTIHIVAESLGVDIADAISRRSAGRIANEAGLAAQLQLVDELRPENCKDGHTISSDGTTIRHRNYESRHVTLSVPSYTEKGGKTVQNRVLGLSTAVNHTSETQLSGLKSTVSTCFDTYNGSPMGRQNPTHKNTFPIGMKGSGSDHAPDQHKLGHLSQDWKVEITKYEAGKQMYDTRVLLDLAPMAERATRDKIDAAGGVEAWAGLSKVGKAKRDEEAMEALYQAFGEKHWAGLSVDERAKAALFLWIGCCMHKEMNSVKGGVKALMEFWKGLAGAGVVGPVKLMNKDNDAAASLGNSQAQARANEISEGGAVKLTSLAGAVFNHKDDKKGQQDTYRSFCEARLGYSISFPDTSNTRFQSHCDAASELIVNLALYLDFLLLIKDKKAARRFSHIEQNVFQGLNDIPTQTELCVLALYSEALSKPYMKQVRPGGGDRVNGLQLSKLHLEVKVFCAKLIEKPELLLLFCEDDFKEGTLDGSPWERPDVVYAVAQMAPTLPYLRGCIQAFFTGALEVWVRLTQEFAPGNAIEKLTNDERQSIFINSTNDHNEGVLGSARIMKRHAPNMNTSKISAKLMYTRNDTESFIQARMTGDDDIRYLMRTQRDKEGSGSDKRAREEEILHDQQEVETKRRKTHLALERASAYSLEVDALQPELNAEILRHDKPLCSGKKITVPILKRNLDWHRKRDFSKQMLEKKVENKMSRKELLEQLVIAVDRHLGRRDSERQTILSNTCLQAESTLMSVAVSWEEQDDIDNEDFEE